MVTTYFLNNRFLPYLLLMMIFLVFIVALLLSVAVNPDISRIYLIFLFIGLVAAITMVSVWITKIQYKAREISDYSLD